MTPGISMAHWQRAGILKREIRPYQQLAENGWDITVLAYGCSRVNETLCPHLNVVTVEDIWEVLRGSRRFKDAIRRATLIKTRQTSFSFLYAAWARLYCVPLLLSGGYVQGEYFETTRGRDFRTRVYQQLEKWAFRSAQAVELATEDNAQWVSGRYGIQRAKISVIDNYVDTKVFTPMPYSSPVPRSVVAVGRLEKVKRHDLLIRAAAAAGASKVVIYGEGREGEALRRLASQLHLPLDLPGVVNNSLLPGALQQYEVFAATSLREGHPKSLAEALSCGLPCVVTNNVGQNSLVSGQEALLVDDSVEQVAGGLDKLFSDHVLRGSLSRRGRALAETRFSYENYYRKERRLLESLVSAC
jgi:glycosyltransferase involved in cell wall biosynthesis